MILFLHFPQWADCPFYRWMRYFSFHMKMAKDVEDAEEKRARVDPEQEPTNRPTDGWLREAVEELVRSEGLKLSKTAKKKAMRELRRAILEKDHCHAVIHKSLTEAFVSVACGWFISGGFLDAVSIDE
jgi:hypothetical protein